MRTYVRMAHSQATRDRAFALAASGCSPRQVGEALSLPRRTVAEWLARTSRDDPAGGAVSRCGRCGWGAHEFVDLPPSYVHLLGLYLGDGCLSAHRRGVYKLRIYLDAAYPQIIEEAATSIAAVRPRIVVARLPRTGDVELYAYSKSWPCLFPQHGAGKKHERSIVLEEWQESLVARTPHLLLRGLIQSDGCRFMNTGRGGWSAPRYVFCNFSAEIRDIFIDACRLVGVRWTTSRNVVYVSRVSDVARLDEFIGPKS